LEYQDAISIYYKQQHALHSSLKVLTYQINWVVKVITNTLLLVVKQCVLNQSQGFGLWSNALVFAFTLCTIVKVEVGKI
jgi:hypothetical protein